MKSTPARHHPYQVYILMMVMNAIYMYLEWPVMWTQVSQHHNLCPFGDKKLLHLSQMGNIHQIPGLEPKPVLMMLSLLKESLSQFLISQNTFL